MKILIAYSSRTGNTKKVAEALYEGAPEGTVLADMDACPAADDFDLIFAGYWADRGAPDAKAQRFLRTLAKKRVVLFQTSGASPMSEHAYTVFANAGTCLAEGNRVIGVFAVQGAVDPALVEQMRKMPKGSAHNSSQMEATVKEAASHPDEEDLLRARAYMKAVIAKIR